MARCALDSGKEIPSKILIDARVATQVKGEDTFGSIQGSTNLAKCLLVKGGVAKVKVKEALVILDEPSYKPHSLW